MRDFYRKLCNGLRLSPRPLQRRSSLRSRTHIRLRIGEPEVGDTAEYLTHRLAAVGCDKPFLTSKALAVLHETTSGAMRDIARITTSGLKLAARRRLRLVIQELLKRILDAD